MNPKEIAKLLLWLAALGGVVLVASQLIAKTASKAHSAV